MPVEFTLPDPGETSPARAVLLQAAEGALPLSSVREIIMALSSATAQIETHNEETFSPVVSSNAYLRTLLQQYGS